MDLSLHRHLNWSSLLQDWASSELSPEEFARELGLAEPASSEAQAPNGSLFQPLTVTLQVASGFTLVLHMSRKRSENPVCI